jgi:hypothetical protein
MEFIQEDFEVNEGVANTTAEYNKEAAPTARWKKVKQISKPVLVTKWDAITEKAKVPLKIEKVGTVMPLNGVVQRSSVTEVECAVYEALPLSYEKPADSASSKAKSLWEFHQKLVEGGKKVYVLLPTK